MASRKSSFSTRSAMNSFVVDWLVSRVRASAPTLARAQSSRNGDTGVFTPSSLLMFYACPFDLDLTTVLPPHLIRLYPEVFCGANPRLVDHRDGALALQHGGAIHLGYEALDLGLHLSVNGNHHAFDRHSHLIDLNTALSHRQSNRLHGVGGNRP